MPSYKTVPLFVKEVTQAIFDGDHGKKMTGLDGFRSALNIARFRLTQYGFLARGSEVGDASTVRMTAKGSERNSKAPSSVPWFDTLAEQLDALDGGGPVGQDLTTVADPQRPTKPAPKAAPETPTRQFAPRDSPKAPKARTRRAKRARHA